MQGCDSHSIRLALNPVAKTLKYIPRNKGRVLFHLCRFFPHSVGLWLQNFSRFCVKIPKLWTLDTCSSTPICKIQVSTCVKPTLNISDSRIHDGCVSKDAWLVLIFDDLCWWKLQCWAPGIALDRRQSIRGRCHVAFSGFHLMTNARCLATP